MEAESFLSRWRRGKPSHIINPREGDELVRLANLIKLQEQAKEGEQKAKEVRLAIWLQQRKLDEGY